MKDLLKRFYKFLIIAIVLEVTIFNFTSYYSLLGANKQMNYTLESENIEKKYLDDGKIQFFIKNVNSKVYSLGLKFVAVFDTFEYKVYYKDQTNKNGDSYFGLSPKNYVRNYEASHHEPLYLSGDTEGLVIEIYDYKVVEPALEEITLNSFIPFDINIIRIIVVSILLFFMVELWKNPFFEEKYSLKNLKQEMLLITITAVFCLMCYYIAFNSATEESQENFYNVDFVDSISKGQLYLDTNVTDRFMELENPYDVSERDSKGMIRDGDYKWDTAYYNGKTYVYFGILPVILFMVPFHFITKKYLSCVGLGVLLVVLIMLLLKEILTKLFSKYYKDISFRAVVISYMIMLMGSLILDLCGMIRFYEIPILSGMFFSLLGINFILNSRIEEKKKLFNMALGCFSLALSVACRPNYVISSFIIAPYLLYMFINEVKLFKEKKKNKLIKTILVIAIPYLLVAIPLMIYNYQRFGSITEFGAKYQITIANMHDLGSRFFAIPIGLIINLFGFPSIGLDFPFVRLVNDVPVFNGYYYIENMNAGVFMLSPICFMCFGFYKIFKDKQDKELKIIISTLLGTAIVMAAASSAMAGSTQRYLADYAWMFTLSGILISNYLLNLYKTKEAKKLFMRILNGIAIYTIIICFFAAIVSESEFFKKSDGNDYYRLKYTICFWE